jgi:hypothetical protein
MTDITEESPEHREVWFIYSPLDKSWANLRIATFTKPINNPELDLVVIHNEIGGRVGVRVWQDIIGREQWVKVRQIKVPDAAEVMAASLKALV